MAVSSGLLRNMPRDQVPLALLEGVLNTFVIFLARIIGTIVDRALSKKERSAAVAQAHQGEPIAADAGFWHQHRPSRRSCACL